MKAFLKLLRKDLEASRLPILFLSGITLAFMAITRYKIADGAWLPHAFVVCVAVPATFFPLWLIWQSFQILRSEWREDTVYTLLVLPVPGWQVMLSKLVSICVEYTVLFVVTAGGTLLFFGNLIQELWEVLPSFSWAVSNAFLLYLSILLGVVTVVIYIQLAFVVSRMVGKFRSIVALWTFVLSTWLVGKLGYILEPLFRWLPHLSLDRLFRLEALEMDIIWELNLAPLVGVWIGNIALFLLTSYLFENYVEIN